MPALTRLCRSTIGKKVIVAVTGLILVLFLIAHVGGNLLYFAGRERINAYSAFLHDSPAMLWGARIVLLVSVIAHIVVTLRLAKLRREARPIGYQGGKSTITNYATRTMILSGPLVAAFVVYHILHFTTGTAHPDPFKAGDVHANVTLSFSNPVIAGVYIVAMVLLLGHLFHGIWSMLQTIGLRHPKYDTLVRRVSVLLALIIVVGFMSIPVYVLMTAGGR